MQSVGFIGLGKLGKDAAEVMQESGYDVWGYDVNQSIRINIKNHVDSIQNFPDSIRRFFVAVPTAHDSEYDGKYPTSHLEPKDFDYSIVESVLKELVELAKNDSHDSLPFEVILISTVLPGTIAKRFKPIFQNTKIDFAYNPYLIAQGTVKEDMRCPEMIMLGTEHGEETDLVRSLMDFYNRFSKNRDGGPVRFEAGTWEEVESMKIFYNTWITTKLCLANLIQDAAMLVGNMNVDVVTGALKRSTDRILGPKYMKAGLGDGGSCHPRDNIALRWLAKEYYFGYDMFDAIMLAREKQAENMAIWIGGLTLAKNKLVVLGSGFKPGVRNLDGSPSLLVGHYLEKLGFEVYYDQAPEGKPEFDQYDSNLNCPLVYFLGWPDHFENFPFQKDSIIVDPWRTFKTEREDLEVHQYGNTRE